MEALKWIAGAALLVVFAYIFTRVVSYAFFRTRLEHLRSTLKELNGGHKNGEE